jgi:hypothetical protein
MPTSSIARPYKILPKSVFLVRKQTIWQPGPELLAKLAKNERLVELFFPLQIKS